MSLWRFLAPLQLRYINYPGRSWVVVGVVRARWKLTKECDYYPGEYYDYLADAKEKGGYSTIWAQKI